MQVARHVAGRDADLAQGPDRDVGDVLTDAFSRLPRVDRRRMHARDALHVVDGVADRLGDRVRRGAGPVVLRGDRAGELRHLGVRGRATGLRQLLDGRDRAGGLGGQLLPRDVGVFDGTRTHLDEGARGDRERPVRRQHVERRHPRAEVVDVLVDRGRRLDVERRAQHELAVGRVRQHARLVVRGDDVARVDEPGLVFDAQTFHRRLPEVVIRAVATASVMRSLRSSSARPASGRTASGSPPTPPGSPSARAACARAAPPGCR
ncbi:hypothetical protein QE416_000669 [Microbacterium sp. SORGH_AS 421]|nr:hypothetical protein [Microbacterium sp. SORGH_AS_0421]